MLLTKQRKQVLFLYISSLAGVFLGMLNSVINTRALDPVSYGDVRYVQNIISFISSLLLVGFFVSGSRLLALSNDETYSRKIRGSMCVVLAGTIVVLAFTMMIVWILNDSATISPVLLASIPLCSPVLLLNYVNTTAQGDNHIGRIALARLMPSALYCVVAFLIYKHFGATPVRMLVLLNGINIVVLLCIIVSTRPSITDIRQSFKELMEENKKYGFNVYLGSVAAVSTTYIAGITLGSFSDNNASVGFYTLALTLTSPLAMLPSIIGTTYFKKFAIQNKIDRKVLWSSVSITLVTLLVFILLIDVVVGFLYDENYSSVGAYSILLAVGTCLHGLGDMFNRFLGAHGQGQCLRNSSFLCGGVLVFGSFVFVWLWGINGAIITKILSSFTYFAAMLAYYRNFVMKHSI